MSGQFSTGDIAIIQNLVGNWACWNGAEVKIISPLCNRLLLNQMTGVKACIDVYECRFACGYIADFPPSHLRKKRPPQSTDEWAESKVKDLLRPVPELEVV